MSIREPVQTKQNQQTGSQTSPNKMVVGGETSFRVCGVWVMVIVHIDVLAVRHAKRRPITRVRAERATVRVVVRARARCLLSLGPNVGAFLSRRLK